MSDDPRPELTDAERKNRFWRAVGITLVVIVTLAGLAMVAAVILFVIALNSWGSNK